MENNSGLIYILTNPSFPNYVKIGKTTNLDQRLRSLNNPSCLPFSFRVYATYKVESGLDKVENSIHNLIDKINYELRAREMTEAGKLREREFFALDGESAYEIIREIALLRGDKNNLIKQKQTKKERQEEEIAKIVQEIAERKKPLTFKEYGIEIGSELVFVDDPLVRATVVSQKQVEYEGKRYSLSALAAKLLVKYRGRKESTPAQGPLYFKYQGTIVADLRKD